VRPGHAARTPTEVRAGISTGASGLIDILLHNSMKDVRQEDDHSEGDHGELL
jgi:hypothetical protein